MCAVTMCKESEEDPVEFEWNWDDEELLYVAMVDQDTHCRVHHSEGC